MNYTVTCRDCGKEYCSNVPDDGEFKCNDCYFNDFDTMSDEEYAEFKKEIERDR